MSDQDYEKFGRHLLSIDSKMARSYLELSHLPQEEVEMLIASAGKKEKEKESKKDEEKMSSEDYRKMAEDHEKKI